MKIVVLGAGAIGVYVGGSLLAAQAAYAPAASVLLLGRARMAEQIAAHGLQLSDLNGRSAALAGDAVSFVTDAAALADASLVIVAVKSAGTAQAAVEIAAHAPPQAVVLSLQNGVGNVEVLRAALPGRMVVGGIVPFNVVQLDGGRFHRGTEGELMTEASPALAPWLDWFAGAGLPLQARSDFREVQWGKLLLNLNNSVNALSNLPLKTELSQRAYRRCLALLIDEALAALAAAGIAPARLARVGPRWLPAVLRLPDWLFVRAAAAMLRIDPEARSSMWDDLQAGRRTEIDYLNGAVVALAAQHGTSAPANARMVALMRAAEQGGPAGAFDGARLLAALHNAR